MHDDHATINRLLSFLETNAAVAAKATIQQSYRPAHALAGNIRVGDDCAAIPDEDGFLLFAAEGMLESFVANDSLFPGYSPVVVNLSDVAAMGGRPLAIVDVLWTPNLPESANIWDGMAAACPADDVPVGGGKTTDRA